ncbi:hypothetical protein BGZ76_007912, partial [Entomortierella beljakovae]
MIEIEVKKGFGVLFYDEDGNTYYYIAEFNEVNRIMRLLPQEARTIIVPNSQYVVPFENGQPGEVNMTG